MGGMKGLELVTFLSQTKTHYQTVLHPETKSIMTTSIAGGYDLKIWFSYFKANISLIIFLLYIYSFKISTLSTLIFILLK